jgi:hypothetical protein
MKNKNKSSKVQKFIAQVDQQSKMAGKNKEQVSHRRLEQRSLPLL